MDQWLRTALDRLNDVCNELKVTPDDWKNPEGEWEPIPLDRSNANLEKAIEAVDETITHVEQNNGYANDHPEERKYVLDNLRMLSNTLKNAATTSIAYVKNHGLSVLQKLEDRFTSALIGEAAKETAKMLWMWLKEATKALF